ncbi:MAG: helix-turn-helix transcriptional regulator [Clostridia bacterium]|nr:helix-turn-helix transcriptional regulator [Clostridia bacterium]
MFKISDIIHLRRNKIAFNTTNKIFDTISIRISGESLFFYNNEKVKVKKGDILFIPYGSDYSQETEGEEILCFHLESNVYFPKNMHVIHSENAEEIYELFKDAYSLWKKQEDNYMLLCLSNLYKIIALSGTKLSSMNTTPPSIIDASVDYLNQHMYDKSLSIDKASRLSHVSRTYFNKLFKDTYECTPIEYVHKTRINKAKILLATENYTKAEIAQLCGFTDMKYFYTLFKKITGYSTGQYLKLHKTENWL